MEILIRFDDSSAEPSSLQVIKFSIGERIERASKIFGILFALAIFSIVIPIFHFILVPGFLVSAFVVAYIRFNETSYIDLTQFNCPKCSSPIDEKVIYFKKNSLFAKIYCFNCRINMRLQIQNTE